MKRLWMLSVLMAVCAAVGFLWPAGAVSSAVTVKELPGRLRVEVDGGLFAEYVYEGYAKPILYPLIGPHRIGMTRNWPMKEVAGEARDHKHHKSLWYTHGDVNGVDFWGEGGRSGRIVQDKVLKVATGPGGAVILTANEWRGPDQHVVCTDTRRVGFSVFPRGRMIDFEITISASNGDVVFGDTKEGTMGIRTHPNLRLRNDPSRGVTTANGHAVNSEGVRDKEVWGKRAKWVDYWGTVGGKVVGVAIFDHPGNPRHPTWWHARDYGLIAANPFGVHDFEGKPEGTGDLKIPAGESRSWRYRFVFHENDAEEAGVAGLYEDFAASRSPDAIEPTTAGGATHAETDNEWAIVGLEGASHRRLFLDPLVVEEKSGVERVFHACEKYPGNPVLVGDSPWELGGSGPYLYGTVMWDQRLLRMWYHFFRDGGYRNAYAESRDGIDWKKPDVGIIAFGGSTSNNLFLTVTQNPDEKPPRKARGQCHNPSVIKRSWLEDPRERYVLFCYGADYGKVRAAVSPDGLRWTFVPETAEAGLFQSSDVVSFCYDAYRKRYVATWKGATRRGRSVGVAVSGDGLHWEKLGGSPIFTADDLDPPCTQVYGMPVFPYQGLYIGLPWIYHAKPHYASEMLMTREEAEGESPCTVDVQLAWSWDLMNWTRPPDRKPFIPRGKPGEFDCGMVYTARAPVRIKDRLYFYYGGFDLPHNAPNFHGAIGIATLRIDGFCSMHAGEGEGWLITRREKMESPGVEINAATGPDGYVRAELLDLRNRVIPGFSLQDCLPFSGDSIRHRLSWRTNQFPGGWKNSPKKIRFFLKNADLYSYVPASPDTGPSE